MDKTGCEKKVTLNQHQAETHRVLLETASFFLSSTLDEKEGTAGLGQHPVGLHALSICLWITAASPSVHGIFSHTKILIEPQQWPWYCKYKSYTVALHWAHALSSRLPGFSSTEEQILCWWHLQHCHGATEIIYCSFTHLPSISSLSQQDVPGAFQLVKHSALLCAWKHMANKTKSLQLEFECGTNWIALKIKVCARKKQTVKMPDTKGNVDQPVVSSQEQLSKLPMMITQPSPDAVPNRADGKKVPIFNTSLTATVCSQVTVSLHMENSWPLSHLQQHLRQLAPIPPLCICSSTKTGFFLEIIFKINYK